jgi:putative DNA primase/helicase
MNSHGRTIEQVKSLFESAMNNNGIITSYRMKASGDIERFHIEGQKKGSHNGWLVLNVVGRCAFGAYGDWVTGFQAEWTELSEDRLSPEDYAQLLKEQAEHKIKIREEKKRFQEQSKKEAKKIFDESINLESHSYISKKNIKPYESFKFAKYIEVPNKNGEARTYNDCLMIPYTDAKGQFMTFQAIGDQEFWEGCNKIFYTGAPKEGAMVMFGNPYKNNIVLGEGVSTVKTVFDQINGFCVAAGDKGNLMPVARSLRELYPEKEIIIIADNDQFTEKNPGVTFANRVAETLDNCRVVIPEFKNIETKPTDFNDLLITHGKDELKNQLKKAKLLSNEPKNQTDSRPFKCLGYGEDKYYFYSKSRKQIIARSAATISESALFEIADFEFWKSEYLVDVKNDKLPKSKIVNNLIQECHSKGLFIPELYTRGRGAWIDDKNLVFHFGDHLNVNGERVEIEDFDSKYVYECSSALLAPEGKALTDNEGKELLDIALSFRWKQSSSALLLAGYIALAPLCGVLRWRPHVWITGGAGSGKSTILNNFVNQLMGNTALFAQGNSTEAGIRQSLKSDALPVVFDEGESNNQREAERMQNVLALIRQSSSDSAAKTLKGTAGGKSMSFHIRSMFCLASIQAAINHQADLERITKLELKNKGGDNSGDEWEKLRDKLYSFIERDEDLSMRLFQRSIDMYETIKENILVFSHVAANKFNSQRKGDQYGTLLAGCWSLVKTNIATKEEAEHFIDKYDWTEYQEGTEVEESEKALTFFFGCKLRNESGREYTIHELLNDFNNVPDSESSQFGFEASAIKTLKRHDIIHDKDSNILYISNTSSHVANLFKGTVYEAGWRDQMLRAKGVYKEPKKQKKFGGRNSRYFYIALNEIE